MLRSLKELQVYKVTTPEGDLGQVHDFYFDDQAWTIRYLVVDTGAWLSERKVLIDPAALRQLDWEWQVFSLTLTREEIANKLESDQPHLRSINEVLGYRLQARDGEIGHLEDFIGDDKTWTINYLIIDIRNWLPGKKVLVSPSWIEAMSESEAKVYIDLARETVQNSPEYDPATLVSPE
jgi:hypothetical protein